MSHIDAPQQISESVESSSPMKTASASCWTKEAHEQTFGESKCRPGSRPDEGTINRDLNDALTDDLYGGCGDRNSGNTRDLADREFSSGFEYLDRTDNYINRAIESIDNCDGPDAQREIERAVRSLQSGTKDLSDGRQIIDPKNSLFQYGDHLKDGMDSLEGTGKELKDALKLVKEGKFEEAKEALREGQISLLDGKLTTEFGVNQLTGPDQTGITNGGDDFGIPDDSHRNVIEPPEHRTAIDTDGEHPLNRCDSPRTGGLLGRLFDNMPSLDPLNLFANLNRNFSSGSGSLFSIGFSDSFLPRLPFSSPGLDFRPPALHDLFSGAPGPQDLLNFASDLPRPPMPHDLFSGAPGPQDLLNFASDLPRPPLPHELLSGAPGPQ
ncbi:MAG: hypothetical protein K8F91_16980, partial [Candidatus Obscuribacterales bacterium]|nr:hypothetical protein [Candidatus Obscuribacterales bacterium]